MLPPSQHRVRYFGWMHPAAKSRRLLVETLLAVPIVITAPLVQPKWHLRCPHCAAFAHGHLRGANRRISTGQFGYWVQAQPFGCTCMKVAKSQRGMNTLAARSSTIGFLKKT